MRLIIQMEVAIIFYINNVLNLFSREKEMAAHSSIFAWRIPWTEEPGGLQSMGLQRVRPNCANTHTHTQICLPHVRICLHRTVIFGRDVMKWKIEVSILEWKKYYYRNNLCSILSINSVSPELEDYANWWSR